MSLKETYSAITRWPVIDGVDASGIARQLTDEDPDLLPETAVAIAANLAAMPSLREVTDAVDLWRVLIEAGPYARMRLYLNAMDSQRFPWKDVARMFPVVWSISRLYRADPRLLTLWERAYRDNGRQPWFDVMPSAPGRYIQVFRGQDATSPFGFSWTTSRDVAMRYATGEAMGRSNRAPVILRGRVATRMVFAYISKGGEDEIITAPVNVRSSPRDGAYVEKVTR